MESIVLCKISSMKFYKGAGPHAPPFNGGSFVKKTATVTRNTTFLCVKSPEVGRTNPARCQRAIIALALLRRRGRL